MSFLHLANDNLRPPPMASPTSAATIATASPNTGQVVPFRVDFGDSLIPMLRVLSRRFGIRIVRVGFVLSWNKMEWQLKIADCTAQSLSRDHFDDATRRCQVHSSRRLKSFVDELVGSNDEAGKEARDCMHGSIGFDV